MGTPTVPYYGKDSDRLARLRVAHNVLADSGELLVDWPGKVATCGIFKERIDIYDDAHKEAVHGDHRWIAKRIDACNSAGATWQKIVNYLCATEEDHTPILVQMGVGATTVRRTNIAPASSELDAPALSIVNLEAKGAVLASCPYERRRYTWDMWVNEGDPRNEDGWYHKASFGDCTKMEMDGFQLGKEYSFRCRIIGRDNKPSNWSHVITIMVT